jgi:prepilin-type N-terminal cleavage/methylation domain-containing protein
MKTHRDCQDQARLLGFSLIELMVVIAIISIVLAAILTQVEQLQQRATAEQGKVDDFQQARDFLDQMFRDARAMGYPNIHNFDTTITTWSPAFCSTSPTNSCLANDSRLAVGLVKLTPTQLEFEGDVDGSGNVSVVSYMVNGSGSCSTCIQRAQVLKVTGDNVTGQTNLTSSAYSVEVQNVQNTTAIFTAYDINGNQISLGSGIDMDNNPTTIDTVRTIQILLKIASPSAIDPKTGAQLEADIDGRVQVSNCSMASTGLDVADSVQETCQ